MGARRVGVRVARWVAVVVLLLVQAGTWGNAAGEERHVFRYEDAGAKTVSVAGDFNGWSSAANPMRRVGKGEWEAAVPLTEGVHYYKFVVDGNRWVSDGKYSDKELEKGDNYGGVNSAVLVGPDARKLPPPPPRAIRAEAVHFDPQVSEDLNVVTDGLMRASIRTQAGDASAVEVMVKGAADGAWSAQPMARTSRELGLDRYAGVAEFHGRPAKYVFEMEDEGAKFFYASGKLYTSEEEAERNAYTCEGKTAFQTPDWAKDAVWYQIFPERFRNGDKSNDPPHTQRWQSSWFSVLPGEAPGMENFYKGKGNVWFRRYGGDIQGIKEELPYLKKLGVTAIYLNPIFQAESMHKYDATDYRHVDEYFGVKGDYEKLAASGVETDDPKTWTWTASDKVFLDFVAEAHRQGFKVIVDGVFNHVGRNFWAFQDVLKNGQKSKYAGWFDVRDWTPPIKYIAWDRGGTPTSDGALPIFKKDAKLGLVHGPREHVLAVTKRWLAPDGDPSRGVDGFRLDVPGDIPHPFWVDWRKTVKETKPEAYISGEIWDWAQAWLQGDQFDAVMNYRFADACQQFFVNQKKAIGPTEFAAKLSDMINAYPLQASLVQMNLLDSHDTDRAASMFMNPDLAYDSADRIQDNGPKYNPAKPGPTERARFEQESVLQMTFLGAPMIYYGDEAGMWGPDDPSNRQPMIWQDLEPYDDPQVRFDKGLFAHYQRLIAIREHLRALRWGYFRPIVTDDADGVLAFSRTVGGQTVYVVLNRSGQERSVRVPVAAGDRERVMVNWLDARAVSVKQEAGGRPVAEVAGGAHGLIRPEGGAVKVRLGPWESAILSASEMEAASAKLDKAP